MKKIYALLLTVLPGVNRVAMFFVLSLLVTESIFSDTTALYSFCVIVSMIGGVGIGTIVIKSDICLDVKRLFLYSALGFLISLPAIVIAVTFFFDSDSIVVLLFLSFSLIINQIYRNELILKKSFKLGSVYEFTLLAGVILLSYFFQENSLIAISLFYFLTSFLMKMLENEKFNQKKLELNEAIFIGYSNLISSGILFFLPVMSNQIASDVLTKNVSLIVSVIGTVSVFPRAIFNMKIKEIKDSLQNLDRDKYLNLVKRFRISTMIIMAIAIVFVYFYISVVGSELNGFDLFVIILSMSSFIVIGQISIPETTMINMIGLGKISLAINFLVFSLFLLSYFIINNIFRLEEVASIVFLTQSITIGYFIRMLFVQRKIRGFFNYESSLCKQ